MKSIFTYPNNSSDHFIDPNYVGSDTEGLQKRIKELKDGTYKSWTGTAPTQSVDNIMVALSMYNDHPSLEEDSGNNTIYKFWENPILESTSAVISSSISSATAVHQTTSNIEFSGNHGFYQGQKMSLSNFNNSWSGLNGNEYYVKKIDSNTIQLAVDSNLTQLIEFYDLLDPDINNATAQHETVANFNFATAHGLTQGMQVTLNNFNGSFIGINSNNYYVKVINIYQVQLATDSGLTNLLKFYNGANGYLTAASPKKYSSNANLTLSPNAGDINTLSDGDVISFSNITANTSWTSELSTTPLYAGNVSGTNFRIYSDQARTIELAPYHKAGASNCTSSNETNPSNAAEKFFVITHPTAPTGINSDFANGMPVLIENFDQSLALYTSANAARYIQNYDSNARTFNLSFDSSGSNMLRYTPFENDFTGYDFQLDSNRLLKVRIPERTNKLPNDTNFDVDFPRNASNQKFAPGSETEVSVTIDTYYRHRWINNTRVLLYTDGYIRFYDYSSSAKTLTLDSSNTITLPDRATKTYGFVGNKNHNTLVAMEYNASSNKDTMHIITDSGSGFSTTSKTVSTDITGFGGFRSADLQVAISDNGLRMVIGDPAYGLSGDFETTGTATGRVYIFERASLSANFDLTSADFTATGATNQKLGYSVAISGDGNVVAAGAFDPENKDNELYLRSSGTWASDSNQLPETLTNTSQGNEIIDISFNYGDTFINSDGTVVVARGIDPSGDLRYMAVFKRTNTTSAWSNVPGQLYRTVDDGSVSTPTPNSIRLINQGTVLQFGDGTHYYNLNTSTKEYDHLGSGAVMEPSSVATYTPQTGQNAFWGAKLELDINTGVDTGSGPKYGKHATIFLDGDATNNKLRVENYADRYDFQIVWFLQRYANTYVTSKLEYIETTGGKDIYYLTGGTHNPALRKDLSGLDSQSANSTITPDSGYSADIGFNFVASTTGDVNEVFTAPTGITAVTSYVTPTFGSSNNTFTESYTPAGSHELFFADTLTNASTGELIEVYTPPTSNIIPLQTLSGATAGALTIATSESNRYRLTSVTPTLFGNTTYLQRTGASTYVPNAEIKQEYLVAGESSIRTGNYSQWPLTTVSTDSNGRISGFSYNSEFPGAFGIAGPKMFTPQTVADTYSAPAVSLALQEDVFDMDTEWDTLGYDADKQWPDNVLPQSAVVTYNQPNQTTVSQTGTKYVRNLGVNKWQVELAYPPMTENQFRLFHSRVQKAKGQFTPFFLNIRKNYTPWLFKFNNLTYDAVRVKDSMSTGDTQLLLEGFTTGNVLKEGSLAIIGGSSDNGNIHTITNQPTANKYGEVKIRLAYPTQSGLTRGNLVYMKPSHLVVTLAEDGFEYSVDTAGRYLMSVKFDLDEWKA